jgi:DNA-binding CsgD family transcriptional regulator
MPNCGGSAAAAKWPVMPRARQSLTLTDVRRIFRLVGEIRELGADPKTWRPHLLRRLGRIIGADMVVSSEVHFRTSEKPDVLRVVDIGWIWDGDNEPLQLQTERLEMPEAYWVTLCKPNGAGKSEQLVAVRPRQAVRGGSSFILSQYPLTHLGALDQLGLHRYDTRNPFTAIDHKLVRLFHVELGRLWRTDALHDAEDANKELSPRLSQTLEGLLQGSSEKQIAFALGLSQHTVHHYVQALHKRFDVASRAELLAKANQQRLDFRPKLSVSGEGSGEVPSANA